ncbi:MAG: hypothetical protein RLZZ28_1212 [Bacteroidota bacterium]|jgi:peroxiredoxin
MKKLILQLLLMPIIGIAQNGAYGINQPQAVQGFAIKGEIKGIKDSTVVELKGGTDGRSLATGKLIRGNFTLKGKLTEPGICQIIFTGYQQAIDIFIGNDALSISGDINNANNLVYKGSSSQNEYDLFKKQFNPIFESLNAKANMANAEPASTRRDSLINVFNAERNNLLSNAIKFSKDNTGSPVSSLVLMVVMKIFESPAQLEDVYTQLKSSAKKTIYARQVEEYLVTSKIGVVGSQALDFTQNNVDGKPVTLASFRGKYVLVDFWASWCRPCRAENPNVVNAYQQFKNKNFTVLGVSLDQSKPNWLDAIKNDNLSWTQVSDLKQWNNEVAQLYRISSIPDNLLIDPTGKIIARGIRGEALQMKLRELLK